MRAYVPRALLTAAVALSAAGCAAGAAGGPAAGASPDGAATGGRYRVLVPALEVTGGVAANVGTTVARDLRNSIAEMERHTSVPEGEVTRAMRQYQISQLDQITARQLAQQINAQLVAWGQVQPGGAGLQANITFIDTRSGDEIVIDNATGANPRQLAQAIQAEFNEKVQGILLAQFCQDFLASQQFDRALENCEQALAIVPNSSVALYGKATALLNMDRDEEALAAYSTLVQADPTNQDALLGAGLAASRLQRGQDALGFYRQYLELNPGDPRVRLTVAGEIAKTQDFVSAFRVLEPAIQENIEDLDFQRYVAQVATAAGQRTREVGTNGDGREFFDAALAAYARVFASDTVTMDAATYRQVIAVNLAVDRTADALRYAERATQQFDTVPALWALQGDVLRQMRRSADAARAYGRVIQLDPSYEGIYIRRALSHMDANNRQAAEADLRVAAERGDRSQVAQVLMSMGGQATQNNQFAEAARLFEMAHGYAAGAQRSDASFFWAFALFRQGDAIARANTQGNAARAREALNFFERALPLARASNHASAAQVITASEQYIANQRAIIEAARGR
jgi:tetratricopeptide (TPR) repeat protein